MNTISKIYLVNLFKDLFIIMVGTLNGVYILICMAALIYAVRSLN